MDRKKPQGTSSVMFNVGTAAKCGQMLRILAMYTSTSFDVTLLRFYNVSCIKKLEIKWEFLQSFPVFQRIFLHAIMAKSVYGGLKSIRKQ